MANGNGDLSTAMSQIESARQTGRAMTGSEFKSPAKKTALSQLLKQQQPKKLGRNGSAADAEWKRRQGMIGGRNLVK